MKSSFQFLLYRLNVVDLPSSLFPDFEDVVRTNDEIKEIIEKSCNSKFDDKQETQTAIYRWGLREFIDYGGDHEIGHYVSVIFARSMEQKDGLVLTDSSILSGTSESSPPLATTIAILFNLTRHLVVVEYNSEIVGSGTWKTVLKGIFSSCSSTLKKCSTIELEEVSEQHSIIELFQSFERVTRVKVSLRLPNPELSRQTKQLYDDLEEGGIREYLQDMKNPSGISQQENARPYSSLALAEDGYKDGEVLIEGFKKGRYEKEMSGIDAVRGRLDVLRDFVRGALNNAKAKETKQILKSISDEIDRLNPKEKLITE